MPLTLSFFCIMISGTTNGDVLRNIFSSSGSMGHTILAKVRFLIGATVATGGVAECVLYLAKSSALFSLSSLVFSLSFLFLSSRMSEMDSKFTICVNLLLLMLSDLEKIDVKCQRCLVRFGQVSERRRRSIEANVCLIIRKVILNCFNWRWCPVAHFQISHAWSNESWSLFLFGLVKLLKEFMISLTLVFEVLRSLLSVKPVELDIEAL
ncbi:hypothetical protein BpHYR1_006275 [Brachionus plicatilis]|uniref:Uncharacterized protein n=1 Tax=Brachionus plicatilis TaxID=10195 RepID=A0A3M7RBE3_BRAPC|nr:hypothetical protein BpHYR1_006275 [Brachionus plicatilis]